jgi:hypothetical protein
MYIRNRRRNYQGPQVLDEDEDEDEDEEARVDDAGELAPNQQSQAAPRLVAMGSGSQRRIPRSKGKGKGKATDSDNDDPK